MFKRLREYLNPYKEFGMRKVTREEDLAFPKAKLFIWMVEDQPDLPVAIVKSGSLTLAEHLRGLGYVYVDLADPKGAMVVLLYKRGPRMEHRPLSWIRKHHPVYLKYLVTQNEYLARLKKHHALVKQEVRSLQRLIKMYKKVDDLLRNLDM